VEEEKANTPYVSVLTKERNKNQLIKQLFTSHSCLEGRYYVTRGQIKFREHYPNTSDLFAIK